MIVPTLARMIVREHMYKPINGRLLCLGRQTIAMTYEQAIELLEQEKYPLSNQAQKKTKEECDTLTRCGKGTNYISDSAFFSLLGIDDFSVMDVSSYEGADILHDLNEPVSKSLEGQFEFIIDGGTFDHLLDLRTAFMNVVKMLTPNGRIFQWNAASNFTGAAYVSLGPDLFNDYYTLNKFADCKILIAEGDSFGQKELWNMYEFAETEKYGWFYSDQILMTIVMAERAPDSTWDKLPVQSQYRDERLIQAYKDNQEIMSKSLRKPYKGSGIRVSHASMNAIREKISVKYREKGLSWVCQRCFNELGKKIKEKWPRQKKGAVVGFKYVGKL